MYYSEGPNDPLIFKQRDDSIFYGRNGFTITNEDSEYVLRDKDCCEIGRSFFTESLIDGLSVRLLTLEKLKGRSPGSIKFGPNHFTPGTVFRVDPSVARDGVDIFTVQSVVQPMPGSIIETTTLHTALGDDIYRSFNVGWVIEIIHRAPALNDKTLKSSDSRCAHLDGLSIPVEMSLKEPFTYVSREKLFSRLESMGLIKKTWCPRGFIYVYSYLSKKKRKKAHSFLRKNPHLVKRTVKESVAIYNSVMEDMYERDVWTDSHLD